MDAYFMKDSKTAAHKLDSDLDDYFANKSKGKDKAEKNKEAEQEQTEG